MASKSFQQGLNKFIQTSGNKTYGEGVFRRAEIEPYKVVPTGSISLDRALGVGGFVEGRLYEIWGAEGAGKTTLCINALASAQRKYPEKGVAVVDVEHRFDLRWAAQHGLDLDRVLMIYPETAEDVSDQISAVMKSPLFSMVLLDSIGAMLPKKEGEKLAEESTVGMHPKIVTRMVKKASFDAWNSGITLLMVNQVRAAIGAYGVDTTTPGGWALKHCTTGKLAVRRSANGALKDGKDQVGVMTTVKVERNSVARAYRSAEYALLVAPSEKYGPVGIDSALEAFTVGKEAGVITLGGAYYTNTLTDKKYMGQEKFLTRLRENPSEIEDIRKAAIDILSADALLDADARMAEVQAIIDAATSVVDEDDENEEG